MESPPLFELGSPVHISIFSHPESKYLSAFAAARDAQPEMKKGKRIHF
jgi:hypothetical protein